VGRSGAGRGGPVVGRSWAYLVSLDPPFISYKAEGKSEETCFVFLEQGP